jgi:small subunit ribosomal protein S23e
MGKPRGLRTARKHVNHRRTQRWADNDYKKAHLGTRWKANPFGGASHAKGIVLEKVR